MKIKYISAGKMGELTIVDIVNKHGNQIEKGDCNVRDVYMLADVELKGWELLYE